MKKTRTQFYLTVGVCGCASALLFTMVVAITEYVRGIPMELIGYAAPLLFGALTGLIICVLYFRMARLNHRLTANLKQLADKNEALRESEENLRITLNAIGDAVIDTDVQGSVMRMNLMAEQLTGWEAAQAVGYPLEDVFAVVDEHTQEPLESISHRVLGARKIVEYTQEVLLQCKDQTTRPVTISAAPILNTSKEVTGMVVVFQDVTKEWRAQKTAESIDKNYRSLIEGSIEGILIHKNFKPLLVNKSYAEIHGYTVDEILAMESIVSIYAEHERARLMHYHDARKKGEYAPSQFEYQAVHKNGDLIWLDMRVTTIKWKEEPAVQTTVFDITERKRMEEDRDKLETQFQQAQKFEATSTLAGGIAHDFNNLLMGVQGNASLMSMYADLPPRFNEKLKNIEHYVQRGAELTHQLLTLSRGAVLEKRPTDLNAAIRRSAKLFARTHKEISIHQNLHNELYKVDADQGQIEQVFLNLFVNALHAMPSGGDIHLESQNTYVDGQSVLPSILESGPYVRLTVTDTGVGMDKKTQAKIFDPFFTTKQKGEGTGLGLTSVYGIIKKHGGVINVYSEKGEGTTFNIYLPASTEQEAVETIPELDDTIEGGMETILLVDDEDLVITVGEEMLELMGYTVLTARNGGEALEIYKANWGRINLVILDIIMPQMGGEETFAQLKAINPDVLVLLSSGYAMNGKAERILKKGCCGFIQKPFDIRRLAKKVRATLE